MVRALFILSISMLSTTSYSQIKFYENYVGAGSDIGGGVVELPDTSYVICGTSTSFGNGSAQAFLLKIDSMGQHIWAKQYGGPETETAKRIFHTVGEGFYVFGESNATTTGDIDLNIYRMDESGVLISEKKVGTPAWDQMFDAIKFSDSSYVIVGETYSTPDGETDGYIVRIDKFGDTLFTMQSNKPGPDSYRGVVNYYDSAFVVGGSVWNSDSTQNKSYLAVFKKDGTLNWEKEYGLHGNYRINDVEKFNGNILTVGYHISATTGLRNDYGLRTDGVGNELFSFEYDVQGDRSYEHIAKYGQFNRLYISIVNDDAQTTGPGVDAAVVDFNDGLFSFNTGVLITGSYDDEIGQILATSDNGAIVVGSNRSINVQSPTVFALKIGVDQDYPNPQAPTIAQSIVSIYENVLLVSNVLMYPNPTKNSFFIENLTNSEGGTIELVSITGDLKTQEFSQNELIEINTMNLKSGIYFVQMSLKSGEKIQLGRVTIQ